VLSIQPRSLRSAQEELRAVGPGARVGHGKNALALVLEHEVLVLELFAKDGLAACAVASGEVAALTHEARDDAVEGRTLVPKAFLHGAQGAEVLRSLGRDYKV